MEEPYWEVNDDEYEVIDMEAEEKLCNELITKEQAFNVIADNNSSTKMTLACYDALLDGIAEAKAIDVEPQWIPVSERLPEAFDEVIITWVNRDPVSYYEQIKDKPMTSTGVYDGERWWWSSSTCADYLKEYGCSPADEMDNDIEVLAWMPLPKPYEVTE